MKVKTFFRDQYFLGTKIKKSEIYLKSKLFLDFTYNLETISRNCVRSESEDSTHWATTIMFQVFWTIMLKRLKTSNLNQTLKKSLADLDNKLNIKQMTFCLAGQLFLL